MNNQSRFFLWTLWVVLIGLLASMGLAADTEQTTAEAGPESTVDLPPESGTTELWWESLGLQPCQFTVTDGLEVILGAGDWPDPATLLDQQEVLRLTDEQSHRLQQRRQQTVSYLESLTLELCGVYQSLAYLWSSGDMDGALLERLLARIAVLEQQRRQRLFTEYLFAMEVLTPLQQAMYRGEWIMEDFSLTGDAAARDMQALSPASADGVNTYSGWLISVQQEVERLRQEAQFDIRQLREESRAEIQQQLDRVRQDAAQGIR